MGKVNMLKGCKTYVAAAGLLLVLALTAHAQPLELQIAGDATTVEVDRTIVVKDKLTVLKTLPGTIKAPPGAALYFWTYPGTVTATDLGDTLEITAGSQGQVTVTVKAIYADFKAQQFITRFGRVTLAIGGVTPPQPPTPPVPPVPPQPPDPFGGQASAGDPVKLRVLVLYDDAKLAAYPKEMVAVLYSAEVRAYLNGHCYQGDDAKKSWRIWPTSVDAAAELALWQKALARPHPQTPWVVIGNGSTGFEGPLPGNIADTLKLLQKYGGA